MTVVTGGLQHLFDSLNIGKAKLWMQVDCRYPLMRFPTQGRVEGMEMKGSAFHSEVVKYLRRILYDVCEILYVLLQKQQKIKKIKFCVLSLTSYA